MQTISFEKWVSGLSLFLFLSWQSSGGAVPQDAQDSSSSTLFNAIDPSFPDLKDVEKAWETGDMAQAESAYLEFRRGPNQPHWVPDPQEPPIPPAANPNAAADRIAANELPDPGLLPREFRGDGYLPFGSPIKWTFNPVPVDDPRYMLDYQASINRMSYWRTLGEAYVRTGNESYAQAWVAQMTDWVEHCPVPADNALAEPSGPMGSIWRSLDAGIRMSESWPRAYGCFLSSPALTPHANALYAKSALEHGRRLAAVLLGDPDRTGNWVVKEASGLFTVGVVFPEFTEAPHFREVALARLEKELNRTVYPDGAETELTPHYHQVAQADFTYVVRLAKSNSLPIDPSYMERLHTMYRFELTLMDQQGNVPTLNDGLPENFVASMQTATSLWPDPEFKFGATLGAEGVAPPASELLPYAGYAVFRSGWGSSDSTFVFLGGPVGSAHWHEDMLSINLSIAGKKVLTEAGHYPYDSSKWRFYVISTAAHSTITVDGKDQQRGHGNTGVPMTPAPMQWLTSDPMDFCAATYDQGYIQAKYVSRSYFPVDYIGPRDHSITHTRQVLFLKPSFYLVLDFLQGSGEHRYDAYFHLDAPDASVDSQTLAVQTERTDGANLELRPLDLDGLQVRKAKGQQDPPLGWIAMEHRPIPTIVYTKTGLAPTTLATWIAPFTTQPIPVKATPLVSDGFWSRTLMVPGETLEVFARAGGIATMKAGSSALWPTLHVDGQTFVLRRKEGDVTWFAGYGIKAFGFGNISWSMGSTGGVVLRTAIDGRQTIVGNPNSFSLALTPDNRGSAWTLPPGGWLDLASGLAVTAPCP